MIGSILLNPLFRKTLGRASAALRQTDKNRPVQKQNAQKNSLANFKFLETKRKEALIQDAAIPFDSAARFDAWLAQELHIFPLWYCPVITTKPLGTYPLYNPDSEFVLDFGFYISMELEDQMEPTYYNLKIEKKLVEIGGLKCLYSDTFFSKEQFWTIYDKAKYDQVKRKYDPNNTYLNLYDKVVNQVVS